MTFMSLIITCNYLFISVLLQDPLGLSLTGNGQDQSNIMEVRTLERILATKRPSAINRYSKLALLRRIHDLDVER